MQFSVLLWLYVMTRSPRCVLARHPVVRQDQPDGGRSFGLNTIPCQVPSVHIVEHLMYLVNDKR